MRLSLLLVAAASPLASAICAQTLEHRPATSPPADIAKPSETPQTARPTLPSGTNLQVETLRHYPMRQGEAIDAELLNPIFVEGNLAVPQNTVLHGKIVALEPDSKTRWHARLRGDFTPFHTVEVHFDELALPAGEFAISAGSADNGAPVLRLASSGARPHQSFVSRYWTQAKNQLHDRIAVFTAPGRGDRALQMLYHQLPYHPERIEAHTMWSFDLTEPLALPPASQTAQTPAQPAQTGSAKAETWSVHALLTNGVTSATAKPGDPVQALVVEPVFDSDRRLAVPQGSVLVGRVSEAKAARSLGRNGKLRFNFQQVRFPQATSQPAADRPVEGSLAGATTESRHDLSLDAEGTVTPRNQSSAIAPLLLTVLAGRALDEDGNITAQTGVASNGFGLVGRFVGMAAGNRNIAAGIGYYAAALSTYENFLRPGRDVIFPKDTRIEIETTPLRAPVLKPDRQ
ncbi:MAG: hypothetical protein ABSB60_05055 [Terracidiphilus sp.]|jgi:hypothetical protein